MLNKVKIAICHSDPELVEGEESLVNTRNLKQVKRSFVASLLRMTMIFSLFTFHFVPLTSPVYADHCPDPLNEAHTDFGCISNDPIKFATSIYGIGLSLIGAIGLLSIIYGAFLVLTSQGDPVRLQNGRSYIMYALIGMGLAVGGYAFYRIITTNVIHLPGFS